LLYVAESIEDFGPCRGYWQFPMERICGMLIPLVKSQIHPYKSLWNNIILNERFNHLKFNEDYKEIFEEEEEEKEYPSHRVFSSSLYEEYEFYFSSKKYNLSNAELKMLKETYAAIFDINSTTIEVCYRKN
jgi:hypothetical protein